jgi:transposase
MAGSDERSPSYEDLLEANRRLERENERLRKEIQELRRLVEELQRRAKRQAAPFSKGEPKRDPKKPGRKPGEAHGPSSWREPPSRWDETLYAQLPCSCPHCDGELERDGVEVQYQEEIRREPLRRRILMDTGRCVRCGRRVLGRHPLQTSHGIGAAAPQLGPDAQAFAVQLKVEAGLSYGKIVQVFASAFGISLSRGGAAQIVLRAGRRHQPAYQRILSSVPQSQVVYIDETGWRVEAQGAWLWSFVTQYVVAYLARRSRSSEVIREVLGEEFSGLLGHDGYASYDDQASALHQQCLQHLLTRCAQMLEVATGAAVRFPRAVKAVLTDALALRDRRDDQAISAHGLAVATGRLEARMDRLLAHHLTNPDNERLAKHLDRHRDELFTFLRHPQIEATNWPAEHAMRLAAVNRKVWGGNRTWAGARAQEALLSVIGTCRKQGRSVIDFISKTLRADSPRRLSRLILPQPAPI